MSVNHYIEPLLGNVTDLANDPPASPADLERRWLQRGLLRPPHPVGEDDFALVTRYLVQWHRLVDAATESSRVDTLNTMLRRYTTAGSITNHDGSGWHLHYRDPDTSFGGILTGATTAAAAQFLCARGMHRLGRCELPDCANAFVDFSRPGKQRYCRPACANRGAVRRHRRNAANLSASAARRPRAL